MKLRWAKALVMCARCSEHERNLGGKRAIEAWMRRHAHDVHAEERVDFTIDLPASPEAA